MIHETLRESIAQSPDNPWAGAEEGEEPSRVLPPVEAVKRTPLTSVVMKQVCTTLWAA